MRKILIGFLMIATFSTLNFESIKVADIAKVHAQDAKSDDTKEKEITLPDGVGPWGKQKRAKPHRRNAGESFPPLPLPATPLRRTERKREPAPPVLVYKMRWGLKRKMKHKGKTFIWEDWNLGPADVQSLVKRANKILNVKYKDQVLSFNQLKADPTAFPILYFHGSQAIESKIFSLSKEQKSVLKDYILNGGTVWFDAAYGSTAFSESVRTLFAELLPDKSFVLIPPDHPLFSCHYEVKKVKYAAPIKTANGKLQEGPAMLEHIMVGCRSAVILSPICLAQGWDYTYTSGDCVQMADAQKIGINMISYALAYKSLGKYLASERIYYEQDEESADFTFGIIATNGYWNTIPSGPANLMKIMKEKTRGRFKLQKKVVSLGKDDLSKLPFLYLAGHGKFTFSDVEIKNLQAFINNDGFLFVDNTDGNLDFQKSFREEIGKVLPKKELEKIDAEHPIFSVFNKIDKVKYSARTLKVFPEIGDKPYLEGIEINDRLRVVYSPFDLASGWEGIGHPWTLAYSKTDAINLSINIILYALTH